MLEDLELMIIEEENKFFGLLLEPDDYKIVGLIKSYYSLYDLLEKVMEFKTDRHIRLKLPIEGVSEYIYHNRG